VLATAPGGMGPRALAWEEHAEGGATLRLRILAPTAGGAGSGIR
jgi:hypothetical protein